MVNDGLFMLGFCVIVSGLFWWFPPSALVFIGLSMILLGLIRHFSAGGADRGKAH